MSTYRPYVLLKCDCCGRIVDTLVTTDQAARNWGAEIGWVRKHSGDGKCLLDLCPDCAGHVNTYETSEGDHYRHA